MFAHRVGREAVLDAHGRIGVGAELCARNSLALRIRVKSDITAALAANISSQQL
jgi:hypothetical protein